METKPFAGLQTSISKLQRNYRMQKQAESIPDLHERVAEHARLTRQYDEINRKFIQQLRKH